MKKRQVIVVPSIVPNHAVITFVTRAGHVRAHHRILDGQSAKRLYAILNRLTAADKMYVFLMHSCLGYQAVEK